jgi:hypothetical protein
MDLTSEGFTVTPDEILESIRGQKEGLSALGATLEELTERTTTAGGR